MTGLDSWECLLRRLSAGRDGTVVFVDLGSGVFSLIDRSIDH